MLKAPLTGAGPVTLASVAGGNGLGPVVVDSTSVYYSSYGFGSTVEGAVMKVPIAGGTVTTLASGLGEAISIAVDSSNVYWGDYYENNIVKIPTGGGAMTTLVSKMSVPEQIAVDSTSLYWTNAGSTVMKLTPK